VPDSIDRRDAWRWANDHFGMPIEIRGGGTASARKAPSPRVVDAADKIERGALAGVIAFPHLLPKLGELPADLFRNETNRALRNHLVDGTEPERETVALKAELDAWGPQEGIDEPTAQTYLLHLKDRELRTELKQADFERIPELTEMLAQLHEAIARLGDRPTAPE
jgi:hypothetical protein